MFGEAGPPAGRIGLPKPKKMSETEWSERMFGEVGPPAGDKMAAVEFRDA